MNGEHKTGGGDTATTDENPDGKTQAELDEEARRRQDVSQHPRMQMMAAIAQKHEAAIDEQLAAEGLSSRTTVGEQQPVNDTRTQGSVDDDQQRQQQTTQQRTEQQDDQRQQQTTTQQPAQRTSGQVDLQAFGTDPVPVEALDKLRIKVKIDGEVREMSMHELRRAAQLDGAAHARLEEANRILREAQEAAKRTTQQPPVGVEGKTGAGDSSSASQDVTAAAEGLVEALFVGDKAAAVETVKKLLAGAQPAAQNVDTDTIARQVVPAVRQQLSMEEAEAQFARDFKDVVKDPILVSVADRFFEEARAADPQKSYAELLTEAGNATRDWFGTNRKPANEPAQSNSRQEKLAAKQRLDEPAALNRTSAQQEPEIPTHSQVIADMRKQRGLA